MFLCHVIVVASQVICLEGLYGRCCRQMDSCWTDVDQHFNRFYIQKPCSWTKGGCGTSVCVERLSTETEMKSRDRGLLLWMFPLIIPFNLTISSSCLFHITKSFFRESVTLSKTSKICQSQSKKFEYQSISQCLFVFQALNTIRIKPSVGSRTRLVEPYRKKPGAEPVSRGRSSALTVGVKKEIKKQMEK